MNSKTDSLSSRIAARAKEKSTSRNARNRAIVLALREDIEMAINDGWSVKQIWETLNDEGKIEFSYQAFCGHVNRLIFNNISASTARNSKQSNPVVAEKQKPAGFVFNPVPNKDDLF